MTKVIQISSIFKYQNLGIKKNLEKVNFSRKFWNQNKIKLKDNFQRNFFKNKEKLIKKDFKITQNVLHASFDPIQNENLLSQKSGKIQNQNFRYF